MSETVVWRADVELAIEDWGRPAATLYAPAHGLTHQVIRSTSPAAAKALHDAGIRKPLALSPLSVEPVADGLARGRLTVSVWGSDLVNLVSNALHESLNLVADVQGHPTVITSVRSAQEIPINCLLNKDGVPASIAVRFVSPTVFSMGRRFGQQQYGLLPVPGLVVRSWLRTWEAAGGETFSAEYSADWLAERIAVREIQGLNTVTVNSGKTALTGFQGMARYAWIGPETWGAELLAALGRFAGYAGTGAKTGYGFGVTEPLGHLAVGRRERASASSSGSGRNPP